MRAMAKMAIKCLILWILYLILQIAMGIGAAVVVLGYMNAFHVHDVELTHFFRVLGIFLMIFGAIVFFVSLIGLLGSCLNNRCLLTTFSALLIILFIVQLLTLIIVVSSYNEEAVANELKSSMQYYYKDKDIKSLWDIINTRLECCGVDSVADWNDNIPNTCCKDLNINDVCHKELANEKPCLNQIVRVIKEELPLCLAYIGIGQLFCFLASCVIYPLQHENV